MKRGLTALTLLFVATACARDYDPCPAGSVKSSESDRCVKLDPGTGDASVASPDGSGNVGSPMKPDATTPTLDGGMDAATGNEPDASVDDAGSDGSVMLDSSVASDAASPADASAPAEAGIADAGGANDGAAPDAGDAGIIAPSCSEADLEAWRSFHLSDQLTAAIGECFSADPGCLTGSCPLDECLRQKAGVGACDACVQEETECVASKCLSACGSSGSDSECRACACANDCIGAFDTCAATALDVCADCNGTTCVGMSMLPPELIMVVLHPLLMGVMP